MNINDIYIALRSATLDGCARLGFEWEVEREYQPTQIGTNSNPTVYYSHVGDTPAGQPHRSEMWSVTHDEMVREERQLFISRISVSLSSLEDIGDPSAMTTSDMARRTLYIMQSVEFCESLRKSGIAVLRIETISAPYSMVDKPGFTPMPTFDIMLQHEDVTRSVIASTVAIDAKIHRV